jgi:hypothetical protein
VANGTTIATFERPLANCDPQDLRLDPTVPQYLVWALGGESGWGYHGPERRGNYVVLLQNGTFTAPDASQGGVPQGGAAAAPLVSAAAGAPDGPGARQGNRQQAGNSSGGGGGGGGGGYSASSAEHKKLSLSTALLPAAGPGASGSPSGSGPALVGAEEELYAVELLMPAIEIPAQVTSYVCLKVGAAEGLQGGQPTWPPPSTGSRCPAAAARLWRVMPAADPEGCCPAGACARRHALPCGGQPGRQRQPAAAPRPHVRLQGRLRAEGVARHCWPLGTSEK